MTSQQTPLPIRLPVSADAAEVLAGLVRQSVPAVCDSCVVTVTGDLPVRFAYPPRSDDALAHALSVVDRTPERAVQVRLEQGHDDAVGPPPLTGSAMFVRHRRRPTAAERLLAGLLVEHASRTVAWQRSEQRARTAEARVANLEIALQNSRHIGAAVGILMSLHKLTQDQAFDLLVAASQHCNRKLRDLSTDVIESGWLDPVLLDNAAVRSAFPSAVRYEQRDTA